MKTQTWLSLLWALGAVTAACYGDRPLYVSTTPSGAGGGGGTSSPAAAGGGGAGDAGMGTGADGGTATPVGCDIRKVVTDHSCALAGACHDANGSGGNFDMASPDLGKRLVGMRPKGGGSSLCTNYQGYYLVPGSNPARGLFLDKLRLAQPPCGSHMPLLPPDLSASEMACVQNWATALTAVTTERGCEGAMRILQEHSCALAGACHDRGGSAGSFDLTPLAALSDWADRLVGVYPKGGGNSMCGGSDRPYLVPGSVPAQGLLLDKLRDEQPPCGARMPALPPLLSPMELDCIQRWANGLTVL